MLKAWRTLKFDRAYSSKGIPASKIWYHSLSAYGRDIGLSGDALAEFAVFVLALDEEFMSWVQEQIDRATTGTTPGQPA